jgi:hypothetical protein
MEMRKYRGIAGYGRPVTRHDERIRPLMSLAEELGFSEGPYVELAFAIERALLRGRWRLHMNVLGVGAALAADQGLSRQEFYQFLVLCFSAGMLPCYIDALSKPEGSFFPLRCERLRYKGTCRRRWAG